MNIKDRPLDQPRYKYGQDKMAINVILAKQAKKKQDKVIYIQYIIQFRENL